MTGTTAVGGGLTCRGVGRRWTAQSGVKGANSERRAGTCPAHFPESLPTDNGRGDAKRRLYRSIRSFRFRSSGGRPPSPAPAVMSSDRQAFGRMASPFISDTCDQHHVLPKPSPPAAASPLHATRPTRSRPGSFFQIALGTPPSCGFNSAQPTPGFARNSGQAASRNPILSTRSTPCVASLSPAIGR